MTQYTITKTRTEQYTAVVEANTEDEAMDLVVDGEVEFQFVYSDDEFDVSGDN